MPMPARAPIELDGRSLRAPKLHTRGTHRVRSPEATLAAFAPLLPRFGITRLANLTGLDRLGVPVYAAVRPNARGLSVAQGKGLGKADAKASAMMEAIESWHGEHLDCPLRYESATRMRRQGHAVCDLAALPLRVGRSVSEHAPVLLAEGFDLLRAESCWVPWESVSTNFVYPRGGAPTFFMSSNGLAAGNHVLEAIAHGLCEVLERDALSLWHARGRTSAVPPRRLDAGAVGDADVAAVMARLADREIRALAWNITSDAGVPAFAASIFDAPAQHQRRMIGMFSGYGCHLSPGIALLRALTEAVQSRLAMISGSRDDLLPTAYRNCRNADDLAALERVWELAPPVARLPPDRSTESFEGDVSALLDAVRGMGLERVVVADLGRGDIGIPVAKVVVPGLEGIILEPSCAPGRRARDAMREP